MTMPATTPATPLTIPDITGLDNIQAAFAYAKHGWYVGPVAPGTKHPGSILGKNWQANTTRTPEIIADTWIDHPDAGIFLHVGRSGGIVLDVDTPTNLPDVIIDALTNQPAPFQRTRRHDAARRHYIYAQPAGRTLGNGLGRLPRGWGDLRGANGVIIVAPSVHPDPDGHYMWGRTGPVPVLPDSIAELLTDTTTPVDVATDDTIRAFITRHNTGIDDTKMNAMLRTFQRAVTDGDSRHQRAVSILTGMMKEAAAGYYPAQAAEQQLRGLFLDAVTQPGHGQQGTARSPRAATEEWRGILAWAVAQAAHADTTATIERATDHAPVNLATFTTSPVNGPTPADRRDAAASTEAADNETDTPASAAPASDLDRLLTPDAPTSDAPTPTWRPVDLTPILNGTWQRPTPTILTRTDGPALIYPGKVHTIYGESESGKSWVAQWAVVEQLDAGQRVLYIDFESDAGDVIDRLTSAGATPEQILSDQFAYVRPEASAHSLLEQPAVTDLLPKQWGLIVMDGVTEALGLAGRSTLDNDEITAWMRDMPRRFARATGAAVVLIDHVVKSAEGRGRFPIGGQAKMAAIDGAAYLIEPVRALGVGLDGLLTIRVSKDRPGSVRPHGGTWRKTDRTQEAARLHVDSTTGDGAVTITLQPPLDGDIQDARNNAPFRPTKVMEKVSRILETMREEMSLRAILDAYKQSGAKAKRDTIIEAVNLLQEDGWIVEKEGPRGARMFRSARVYRPGADPHSDEFEGDLDAYNTTVPDRSPTVPRNGEDCSPTTVPPFPSPYGGNGNGHTSPGGTHNPPTVPHPETFINKLTGEITTNSQEADTW